jgi:O-antigen ligase
MELTASGSPDAITQPRRLTARIDLPAVSAWTLAFAIVAYLALSNGGYDTIVRSQVGIAVWWIVLLGALAGVLPMRFGVAGWVAIGLLAGFALWTGVAATWSESAERSVIELGRVATYLGVLILALGLQGRAAARHTINGLACAIGFVTLLAVLSRLHPQWFPANDHFAFLGEGSARKLSYPLNYWNALAAFTAIGVPLLLGVALGARTLAGQALAAAALPVSALCVYLTISRGGTLALVVGIVVFLLFVPRRLDALGTLVAAGLGSAILVSSASHRDALQDGLPTATAIHQGTQMIGLAAVVCAVVALAQIAMALATRHLDRPQWLAPSRRMTALRALAIAGIAAAIAIGAGVPGQVNDRWQEFKAPATTATAGSQDNVFSRLQAANGNGRYELWQSAQDANATAPWNGIGPGTFEFWWARHGTTPAFARDAHTFYFETLAESGITGLALLIGLLVLLLAVSVVNSLRSPPAVRVWIAAAVGGLAAFMTAAAFEWVWEMAAIAGVVMVLGSVILSGRDEPAVVETKTRPAAVPRVVVALLAVMALGAVGVPMAGAIAIRDSRNAASEGQVVTALKDGRTARRLQPYAATPHLQQALVLEQAGALSPAAAAVRAATVREPTNWRPWFVLGRIDVRRGAARAAVAALRRARALNPRSPLLGAK